MAVPHGFYTGFQCKTTFMAAGTGMLMGYFISVFVPPWLYPLLRLSLVPIGGLVAVLANLWLVRSYFKGSKRGPQPRAADAGLAFARFDGNRHSLFENLRVIEGPQAIDDRNVIARARSQADAVADLAGEDLDFALVAPLGRRRKMLRRVRRRFAGLDLTDHGIEAIAHLFVPILFFGCRPSADDERPIGAAAVTHISRAAVGTIDEIADLNDPAGRVRAAIEGRW